MSLTIFIAHPSALLTDREPHGDGLMANGFIRGLAAHGHEIHVAAQRVSLDGPFPENVHVHRLGSERPVRMAKLGYMPRMRLLFEALNRRVRFDVAHQLGPVDVGLSLAMTGASVPMVLGPYMPGWPAMADGRSQRAADLIDGLKRYIRAAQQRRASTVLLSTSAARTMLNIQPDGRLLVRELPAGIDERIWRPARGRRSGEDILFLGNLERRKGIFTLLDAFAELSPQRPQARLLIGGDGTLAPVIRARVQSAPELKRVRLLGRIERPDVPDLIRSSDVMCVPSLGEPFGMTALEAMACGKPLVVTAAGGLRHLVDDQGGIRVPPADAGALSAALTQLLEAPSLRTSMGEHNRDVVESRYRWERVITCLERVYEETIAGFRKR